MINENKPLPNEVDGLESQVNNSADNLGQIAQDFSASETDPPTKTNGKVAKPEPTSAPTPTDTLGQDPLANIGNFMQGTEEGGREQNLKVNLEDYSKYFGGNIGYVGKGSLPFLDRARAERQGAFEQFRNASTRIALNTVPEIIGQLANIVDFEDYFNSDDEVGNWLTTLMNQAKESVNESNPIYRENPNTPLDVTDSGWWFENGSSLITSAGAFVATGYLTGGASLSALQKLGQGAKWAKTLGRLTQLTSGEQNAVRGLSALTNAIALNQAEGVGIGMDTFEASYAQAVKDIKSNPDNINLSEDDVDKMARQKAGQDASSAVAFNKLNILFNLTSAAMFLKTPMGTRNLLSPKNFKKELKDILVEGGQEYAEETVNDIAQQQALAEKYTFKDAMAHMLSAEGVESGLLGFIGGAGQTAMTKIGKRIPMQNNVAYQREYIKAYNKTDSSLSSEERDSLAEKEALAKVGTKKPRVSDNFLHNRRYAEQQEQLLAYDEMSSTDKINDITSAFITAEQNISLLEEIEQAKASGDNAKVSKLQDMLLDNQMLRAFELGTTKQLLDVFESYKNLSTDEAAKRGIDTEQDYKAMAEASIKRIKQAEEQYIESRKYINADDVYNISRKLSDVNSYLHSLDEEFEIGKSKLNRKYGKEIRDDFFELLPDATEKEFERYNKDYRALFYDFSKASDRLKELKEFQDLVELQKEIKDWNKKEDNLLKTANTLTSRDFQDTLANLVKENQKQKKKEYREAIAKKAKDSVRQVNNKLVNTFKKDVATDSVVNTDEAVTPVNENVEGVTNGVGTSTDISTEAEVVVPQPSTTTQRKQDYSIDAPSFTNPMLIQASSQAINEIKRVVEDKSIPLEDSLAYLKGALDNMTNAKTTFTTSFPLEANSIDTFLSNLSTVVEGMQQELNNTNNSRGILSNLQQELLDDINEEVDEDLASKDATQSPSKKADYEKLQARQNKFIEILKQMDEVGVDTSDFKSIIKSFEEGTSKDEVIKAFNMLKALYNGLFNQAVEGTYEEIMYDTARKNDVSLHIQNVRYYNADTNTYINKTDDISESVLQLYKGLAELNGQDITGMGVDVKTYNKTAANKLAYLARYFNTTFKFKTSDKGYEYVEVRKEDINNLLNDTLDERVLSSSFSEGTEIEFVPLTSITLQDGTIKDRTNTSIDDAPIGIKVDGSLVDGVFLHDVSWIGRHNLDHSLTHEEILEEQQKLRELRAKILNSPSAVKATIIFRGPGVPILDANNELRTLNESMPDVRIGIARGASIATGTDTRVKPVNPYPISEGKTVALIPYGKETLALPLRRAKISTDIANSIKEALYIYLEGKVTDTVKDFRTNYNVDILTQKGIESYLSNFIYLGKEKFEGKEEFTYILNSIPDNVPAIQFQKGVLHYGFGQGINQNTISKDKNKGEERDKDLAHLVTFLLDNYSNIDLSKLNSKAKVPLIKDGKLSPAYESYEKYAKEVSLSPYLSFKLSNGETIYTIQSQLRFRLEDESVIKIGNTDVVLQPIKPLNPSETEVKTPTGKIISFDNTIDFSPIVKDIEPDNNKEVQDININELLDSTSLIKGVNPSTLLSLNQEIANDVYAQLLEKGESDFNVLLKPIVSLHIQGLDMVVDTAKERVAQLGQEKVDFIENQVKLIKDNISKVYAGVKAELSSRINIKESNYFNSEKLKNSNENVEADTDAIERNNYIDTLQYSVDPRTTLTAKARQFLEGIVEVREVSYKDPNTGEDKVRYIPVKNLLQLSKYVRYDLVFRDLLTIVSKSNNNFQHIKEGEKLDESFGELEAYEIHFIKAVQLAVETKPYLSTVINKFINSPKDVRNSLLTALNKTHTNHIYSQSTYNKETKKGRLELIRRLVEGCIAWLFRNGKTTLKMLEY